MKKFIILIFLFSFQLFSEEKTLTILHWNDFHAQNSPIKAMKKGKTKNEDTTIFIGGSATLSGYINDFKKLQKDILVLNAGDDFQGTPISSITNGMSQIELMNMINPDAVCLGNHEFDYGDLVLKKKLESAKYPVLCANLWDKKKLKLFAEPYKIIEKNEMKIGVIGVLPKDFYFLSLKKNIENVELLNTDSVIFVAIESLKKQNINFIILLSHLGFSEDTTIANKFSDIDVIVGGHSHTQLFVPVKKNNSIIVQAGSKGAFLGKLDLKIENDSITSYNGILIETRVENTKSDSLIEKKVKEFESQVDASLNIVIGELQTNWIRTNEKKESDIGNWQSDGIRKICNTDIAFMNSGGIRKDLQEGKITVRDIWEINPFGNTFQKFKVTGKMLLGMLEWQISWAREFAIPSGIRFVFDSQKPLGKQLTALEIIGKNFSEDSIYTISTNNFISSHLYEFFGLKDFKEIEETGIVDRDGFIELIKKEKKISSSLDSRVVDKSKDF